MNRNSIEEIGSPLLNATTIHLHDWENYYVVQADPIDIVDVTKEARSLRLQEHYRFHGLRRSIEIVMLVHVESKVYLLLWQSGQTFFMLPNGELKPRESEFTAIKRIINQYSGISDFSLIEMVGQWNRPGYGNMLYPWPLTDSRQTTTENKRLFLVELPIRAIFKVPKNLKLVALALEDLFNSPKKYGHIISSLPDLLGHIVKLVS